MNAEPTSTSPIPRADITGVILAGGRGSRMGGEDKGFVALNGSPMVAHVVTRLRPQVGDLVISANRNQDRYRSFGARVVPDLIGGYQGPLAGIAAALRAATT